MKSYTVKLILFLALFLIGLTIVGSTVGFWAMVGILFLVVSVIYFGYVWFFVFMWAKNADPEHDIKH